MTDEWARPSDGVAGGVVVEVPLVGDDPASTSTNGEEPPAPNWRRAISVAMVGGALGGIALSIVLLTADEKPAADDGLTTVPADGLSSLITTPPTLEPLTPLPRPDDPAFSLGDVPQPTTGQERTLFDPSAVPPTYPPFPGVYELELGEYDIEQAVVMLGDDVPRRSRTHLELGVGGFVLDVTIVRDPERDRYQVTVDSGGQVQTAIVDGATDTTYVNVGTDNRVEVPNDEIFADSDAASINEYFDRMMLGPLRPDTIGEARTQGRDLVMIDGLGLVRRFVTTIPGSLIPEWQLYAFSPVFEFPVEDRPSRLDYFAYVDTDGDLVQIDGKALVGDVPQLVQHRIERLDPPEPVDLAIGTAPPDTAPPHSEPADG